MLRDKNLIPLSHQHQRALALCVRIDRASPIAESDSAAWNAELQQIFRREIAVHFSAEEQIVFPAAGQFKELAALVEDLLVDHAALREYLAKSEEIGLTGGDLAACGKRENGEKERHHKDDADEDCEVERPRHEPIWRSRAIEVRSDKVRQRRARDADEGCRRE